MAFIPILNVVQVELVFNWNGQVVENVLHYSKASPWNPAAAAELGAGLVTWWNTGMKPIVSSTLQFQQIKFTDLASETGFTLAYATGLPLNGTSGSPSSPNNVTVAMTKRTALRGRSYRGRIFHLGLVEEQCVNSALNTGVAAGLVALYAALTDFPLTGDEAILCVASRYNNGAPRVTGVATPVVSITTDGVIDSQRRRLPGRGS